MLIKSDNELIAELGKRIRAYRIAKRVSQRALASKAGVHENTLRSMEHGGDVTLASFVAVLRALGERHVLEGALKHPPPRDLLASSRTRSPPQRIRERGS